MIVAYRNIMITGIRYNVTNAKKNIVYAMANANEYDNRNKKTNNGKLSRRTRKCNNNFAISMTQDEGVK